MSRNTGVKSSIIKIVVGYVLHEKQINRIRRNRNGSVSYVSYEALNRDAETQIRRVCCDLGLSYEPNMLQTSFSRNSSFKTGQRRRFNWQKRWLARLTYALARCFPLAVLVQLRARFRERSVAFIPHTFAEIGRKHDLH